MLSERSQTYKFTYRIIPFTLREKSRTGKSKETESSIEAGEGWEGQRSLNWFRISFAVHDKLLEIAMMVAQHFECAKYHWILFCKLINFISTGFQFRNFVVT
jgi:hypothetical protein